MCQLFLAIFFDAKNLPFLKDGTAEKAACLRTYALDQRGLPVTYVLLGMICLERRM